MESNKTTDACQRVHDLKSDIQPFNRKFDSALDRGTAGLYAFWLGRRCLYVGMSKDIRRRLHEHRVQEHNAKLKRYFIAFTLDIDASLVNLGDLSENEIRRLEQAAIHKLRPAANIASASG